jgi:hypothetical protein
VFRESICDGDSGFGQVTLAVWFHLRGIPQGSRVRRFLFERLCLVNTILFAGFDGYRVKLWMVNPDTADYAGLYSWRSVEEAEVYARYIVGVLSPLSTSESVGYQIFPDIELEDLLTSHDPALSLSPKDPQRSENRRSNEPSPYGWQQPASQEV